MSTKSNRSVSPLAPRRFPSMPAVSGVMIGTAQVSGSKKKRDDTLLLISLEPETKIAGVFTKSATVAAPVSWCRQVVARGRARALVVNAGNANAFTGASGRDCVEKMAAVAASLVGGRADEALVASTGVIGETLEVAPLVAAMKQAWKRPEAVAWEQASRAIMTTDTYPKGATRRAEIDGQTVILNGITKGSGMIAPDMATVLGFVFTDAALSASVLRSLLKKAVKDSFNAITVDSDTSTNDSVLLCATGAVRSAKPLPTRASDPRLRSFREALESLMQDLAQQVVRDGEGARKFITVKVSGARSEVSARRIAFSIANSPLVKTAIAGEDANWGRIVMAAGKAGEPLRQERIVISIGGITIARRGQRVSRYKEAPVARHMKKAEIDIHVDAGVGKGEATVWTCDLTHDYISINADYRS
ncbi:MAG: bifunctional glutamate N-acetyltransferase/amino-acid acetyltransferase ArgJ [Parvularculales bacterium]